MCTSALSSATAPCVALPPPSLESSPGVVVAVLLNRRMWSESFKEFLEILVQAFFVVVDEHRRRDVHGVHQTQPFLDAALVQTFLDLRRDVYEFAPCLDVEPEFFAEGFHGIADCDVT